MNELIVTGDSLPDLLARAAATLAGAQGSAEVLEARDMARVAYDAAKSAGRMARAKQAHDEVIGAVYRAQADALLIEARAKVRLADEYDAAQDRGEVARIGDNLPSVADHNAKPTAADLGLRRDQIHEARQIRDAEAAEPGKVARTLAKIVEGGEEPTRARLRRELQGEDAPSPSGDDDAKLRAECRRLTPEAMLDDLVAVRMARRKDKARIADLEARVAALKAQIAAFEGQSDIGRALGNAMREAAVLRGRLAELQTQLARAERAARMARTEAGNMKTRLEAQIIPMEGLI